MPDKTILADTDKKMGASVQDARHKLAAVRTGRASLAMFDGVRVDYYGTPTPLNQVAKLSIPEPTMVIAQPLDPSTLGAIEKAILLRGALAPHTETGPAVTGGDIDANWDSAYSTGDEAPGGDMPTPDQGA